MINDLNILLVRGGGIGDIILSIPALYGLKQLHPDCSITFLSNWEEKSISSPISMLYKLELIDDHISIPFINKPSISNYFQLVKILYNERNKYQISICLRHSLRKLPSKIFDYLLFKYFLNVKAGIGFWNSSELSRFPSRGDDTYPMIQEYKRLIYVLCSEGLSIDQNNFEHKISDLIKEKIETVPFSYKDKIGIDNVIVLCPFGRLDEKKWDYKNYIRLSKILVNKGKKIAIIGSREEFRIGQLLKEDIGSSSVNLCGKLNIIELCKLFKASEIYIGNDTGPMHIAGLLNIPTVALFSRHSNPGKFYPMGGKNHIIRNQTSSINSITVDEVLNGINLVLGTNYA
jgi:heptosyltransferase-2